MNSAFRIFIFAAFLGFPVIAAKQKVIVKLREPLRAEVVKVRLTELTNNRGETRDLETTLDLGTKEKVEAPKIKSTALKLDLNLRNSGAGAVQVLLTLPEAGMVEVVVMDFYGKSLNNLFSGNLTAGVHPLGPFQMKDSENNGVRFITLRINGKMVLKKVMTKVH